MRKRACPCCRHSEIWHLTFTYKTSNIMPLPHSYKEKETSVTWFSGLIAVQVQLVEDVCSTLFLHLTLDSTFWLSFVIDACHCLLLPDGQEQLVAVDFSFFTIMFQPMGWVYRGCTDACISDVLFHQCLIYGSTKSTWHPVN